MDFTTILFIPFSLFVLFGVWQPQTVRLPLAEKVELIQVDTGNSRPRKGALNMPATAKTFHSHGTQMATALEIELHKITDKYSICALQTVWNPNKGHGFTSAFQALQRAITMKPKVISMSWGGDSKSKEEQDLIFEAVLKYDILFVAAAGNISGNATKPYYPAQYIMPCLISVGTKKHGKRYYSSNVGEIYIEWSRKTNGTSYSTAQAAAYAIVLRKTYPKKNCQQIEHILLRQHQL